MSDDDLHRLLLAACRRDAGDVVDSSMLVPMLDPACSERFVDLAARHHVSGLALSSLLPLLDPSPTWDGVREEWAGRLRDLRRRAAMFDIKRDRVLAELSSSGIRAVVLKGTALRVTVYEQPVERDLEDLDLLVRLDEVHRCVDVLDRVGYALPASGELLDVYRSHHFHHHLRDSDGHIVEIHWEFVRPGRPFSLTPSGIRDSVIEASPADGLPMLIPTPHHLVLQIVLQNLQEGFSKLGRTVDIDRLASTACELDWDALVAAAWKGGLQSAAAMSLQLGRRLLGTNVPDHVARRLSPSPVARFHLAIMRPEDCLMAQRFQRAYSAAGLFELWLVRRLGTRLRQLCLQLGEAKFTEIPSGERPRALERASRLVKLVASQLFAYGDAIRSLVSRQGRQRTRFWSLRGGAEVGG